MNFREGLPLLKKGSEIMVKGGVPQWMKREPSLTSQQADNGRQDTTCSVTDTEANQARHGRTESVQHRQFMWEVRVHVCERDGKR